MPLSSKERAALRGEANRLRATVHIGQHGLTETARQTVDDASDARAGEDPVHEERRGDLRDAASELATALGADVVQVIGKTATLLSREP